MGGMIGPKGWSARVCSTKDVESPLPEAVRSYKVFVDDMREIPPGWIGCRTVSETISILATLPVSEISLDHDILAARGNNSLYQALATETFRGIAYYIAAMPPEKRPKVRIHTANAGAAQTMCGILGLPFGETYKHYAPENY